MTVAVKAATPTIAAGLGSAAPAAGAAVSASVGQAGFVGGLAVPPSWAVATPAIRTVAAVLSGTSEDAIGAAAVSAGSFYGGMAVAGMAGGALGAALPRAVSGVGGKRRGIEVKEGTNLKDSDSPENLQRVVADMAKNPDTVQHWHTDPDHLDGLLAELRKKPGTHAVHVKNGKPMMTQPNSQSI
jgi:PPE-repeat protein